MKSWKTTVAGWVVGLGMILPQIGAIVDDDPDTNPSIEIIIMGLGVIAGGTAARDDKVTSEKAGAK